MRTVSNKWLRLLGVATLVSVPSGCAVCVGRGACDASATCAAKVSQCSKMPFKLIFIRKVEPACGEFACHSAPAGIADVSPWTFASGEEYAGGALPPEAMTGGEMAMLPSPVVSPVDPNCPTCNGERIAMAHPSPPPRTEAKEEVRAKPPAEPPPKPVEAEPLPMPTIPDIEDDLVGSLTLSVEADKGVAAEGDVVQFEIGIRNQGSGAIPQVNMQAVLSDNVTIEYVLPANSAKISGNTVTFDSISNFQPMELEYTIGVKIRDMASENARITVEAKSPILRSGPLKEEAIVRLPPNG